MFTTVKYRHSPPFSPAEVTGLLRWWKADRLTLNNNDTVQLWPDYVGFNAYQNTSGFRPVFKTNAQNGKPEVRFDGVDDYLNITPDPMNVDIGPGATFIIAANLSGSYNRPDAGIICGCSNGYTDGGSEGFVWSTGNVAGKSGGAFFGWRGESAVGDGLTFPYDAFKIWTVGLISTGVNPGNHTQFIRSNGVQLATKNLTNYFDGVTLSNGAMAIGSRTSSKTMGSTVGNTLKGAISEVIMYNRYIGTDAIVKIEKYLNAKYAVY